MKLLKAVPEAAMVAAFLKAEFSSARFSGDLKSAIHLFGVDVAVITQPDIASEQENEQRARVLGGYRGYRQNREMFKDIPENLKWYEAELSREEIGSLRYVNYSYWNELTDNTHLVKDGAANIRKGKVVFNISNDRFWAFAERIRHGEYSFGPMILWGQDSSSPLEILEGHMRATALGLAGGKAPAAIEVLVGLVNAPDRVPEPRSQPCLDRQPMIERTWLPCHAGRILAARQRSTPPPRAQR
jgi:hypothetical protein